MTNYPKLSAENNSAGWADCIEHTQKGSKEGYGRTNMNDRTIGLHRKAFLLHHGLAREDIDGLLVRHRCDNPRCINPEHLELGTYVDNSNDMKERGRQRHGTFYGEANPNAKLTRAQVEAIRKEYAAGGVTQAVLAAKYGVCATRISRIKRGESWS